MASFALLVLALVVLILLGMRIGVALGIISLVYLVFVSEANPNAVVSSFFDALNSFPLMAAPLFVLAGNIMSRTGLIRDLFDLGGAVFGRLPAGLAVGAMFTCIVFAAITGSSVAGAAAMSAIAIPALRERNYPDGFSAGLICSGGTLGLLIPPSLTLIVYGVITNTSIAKLFIAGIVPGLILGGMFIVLIVTMGLKQKYPTERTSWARIGGSLKRGIWALLLPVVVLGGIYGGLFTPTEAASVSVAYALAYGVVAKRLSFIKEVPSILSDTLRLTAVLTLLFGGASILARVITLEQVPNQLAQAMLDLGTNKYVLLAVINVLYLLLGCLLDGLSLILITVPLIFPLATSLGIDPIQLGIILTVNIELGVITPPVGLNLYTVAGLTKIPIGVVLKGAVPFMLVTLAILVLVTYVPDVSLLLMRFMQ